MNGSMERNCMQVYLSMDYFDEGEYCSYVGSSRHQMMALRQEPLSRRMGSEKQPAP